MSWIIFPDNPVIIPLNKENWSCSFESKKIANIMAMIIDICVFINLSEKKPNNYPYDPNSYFIIDNKGKSTCMAVSKLLNIGITKPTNRPGSAPKNNPVINREI